jgi:hypothetical protein
MKFVTYLRVSTERQGQSGLGLEAQRAAVAAHVLGRGEVVSEFVEVEVEVESGKRADRPELARALAEAKRAGANMPILAASQTMSLLSHRFCPTGSSRASGICHQNVCMSLIQAASQRN